MRHENQRTVNIAIANETKTLDILINRKPSLSSGWGWVGGEPTVGEVIGGYGSSKNWRAAGPGNMSCTLYFADNLHGHSQPGQLVVNLEGTQPTSSVQAPTGTTAELNKVYNAAGRTYNVLALFTAADNSTESDP